MYRVKLRLTIDIEERKKVAIVIRLLLVSKLQFNVDKSSKQKTTILVDHNEILKNILRQKISYFLITLNSITITATTIVKKRRSHKWVVLYSGGAMPWDTIDNDIGFLHSCRL